jgi:hypothetical protein
MACLKWPHICLHTRFVRIPVSCNLSQIIHSMKYDRHGIRWLVAGFSSQRPGFEPESYHVRFVAVKVALGQVFFFLFLGSPVSIIPPWLSILVYYLGDKKKSVGGCSSETLSHHIHMDIGMCACNFDFRKRNRMSKVSNVSANTAIVMFSVKETCRIRDEMCPEE